MRLVLVRRFQRQSARSAHAARSLDRRTDPWIVMDRFFLDSGTIPMNPHGLPWTDCFFFYFQFFFHMVFTFPVFFWGVALVLPLGLTNHPSITLDSRSESAFGRDLAAGKTDVSVPDQRLFSSFSKLEQQNQRPVDQDLNETKWSAVMLLKELVVFPPQSSTDQCRRARMFRAP